MLAFIAKRLAMLAATLVVASFVIYGALYLAPGSPLAALTGGRGFGSVPVEATIGRTHWRTSLFPSKSAGGFMLPLKAAVRRAEGFGEGDSVRVILKV